jgi:hypothetical protein
VENGIMEFWAKDQEIKAKDQEIRAKDQEIKAKDQEITAKDQEITAKDQEMTAKDQEMTAKDQEMTAKVQEIQSLKADMAASVSSVNELQRQIYFRQDISQFSVSSILEKQKQLPNLFRYYTGLTYARFAVLLSFLLPVVSTSMRRDTRIIEPCDCLLLTLCRLRHNYGLQDLACRFAVSAQSAGEIFSDWINHMYLNFGSLGIWSHRDVVISNMPEQFKREFGTTLAIIDCTELPTQTPNALTVQSQCYSDYKSTTTLKCLIGCDPNGSLLFVSSLFTGSISDNKICAESGFFELLKQLIDSGYIQRGDGIMADKGFTIQKELNELGLLLNIPPMASSTTQMTKPDVLLTRKIAKHRVHIERLIGKVKKYKIVSHRIPGTLFKSINQIWTVCCFLTLFDNISVPAKVQ